MGPAHLVEPEGSFPRFLIFRVENLLLRPASGVSALIYTRLIVVPWGKYLIWSLKHHQMGKSVVNLYLAQFCTIRGFLA